MVFEILGVNLLEIIKRYNYRGIPLPLVRIMARQMLIGLDFLHRICKIIHTDLKPENVLLCLTQEELKEVIETGLLGKSSSVSGAPKLGTKEQYLYGARVVPDEKELPKMPIEEKKEKTIEEKKEQRRKQKRDKKKRLKQKKKAAKNEEEKELEKAPEAPIPKSVHRRGFSESPVPSSLIYEKKIAWNEYEDLLHHDYRENNKDNDHNANPMAIDRGKRRGPRIDESVRVKIVDLGNACWTYHHFTPKIQTRQYRSPEVILGAEYGPSADIWSFACMIFELITGDFLFEPRKGDTYDKNDDHLAQMIELLNIMPKTLGISGAHSKRFFTSQGVLRNIQGLHYWPLKNVLLEKYRYKEVEAQALTDFLMPMLEWDPQKRASAKEMISHPWLYMPASYKAIMREKEYRQMSLMRKFKELEAPPQERNNEGIAAGIGILGPSFDEMCQADLENNLEGETSEDEEEELTESSSNKYGPNSPLLNIDHGPNPQFYDQ